jgi:hypothetical protein
MNGKRPTQKNDRQELDALIEKVRAKVRLAPEKARLILGDWASKPSKKLNTTPNTQHTLRKKAG